jgi:fibulin 1/2
MTFTDIDECAIGNPCDDICRNTVGAFECLCAEGFQLNNDDQCVDIDECLNDPCEGICINTQGSYSCSCELGYQLGDNGTCSGKNKLSFQKKGKDKHGENFTKFVFVFQMSTNVLAAHARSSASILQDLSLAFALLATSLTTTFAKVKTFKKPNSDLACFHDLSNYLCIFVWKNNKKKDIDECQKQPCGTNAKCINNEGSFACQCEPGYALRGRDCEGKVNFRYCIDYYTTALWR